ncbi:MAG: hypothetical protein PHY12_09360 [Eubacteriales bacterium]|nr:hypothetical protein [Eubacteriales bacterium]
MKKARIWGLAVLMLLLPPFTSLALEGLRPQGSADLAAKRTLILSIYVQAEDAVWTDKELAYTRSALDTAARYIMDAASRYGRGTELIYAPDDLRFTFSYPSAIVDSLDTESDTFENELLDYLHHLCPQEALMEKYQTDSVAFLFFMDLAGRSYAMPYYAGDTDYCEFDVIYLYDSSQRRKYESVPVYAHELLHLFGAVDLYEAYAEDGVTDALVKYVAQTYPRELMYDTYEPDGSVSETDIAQTLSDLTLYTIGLIDDTPLLDLYPSLAREAPGAFVDKSAKPIEAKADKENPLAVDWSAPDESGDALIVEWGAAAMP